MTEQAVFRAIADPTRRAIMSMLANNELTVTEVASAFEMTRPAVAKHLRILRDAELIKSRKNGRETISRLQPERLKTVSDWLGHYSVFWDDKLMKLKIAVEGEND